MNVAILGGGLIGGSVGLALKEKGMGGGVVVYDLDPDTARRAVERGAADRAAGSPEDAVVGADLVVVATPVGAIVEVVCCIGSSLSRGAVVTDVGSTKTRVVGEVETCLPEGVSFVGGHPMAGTEDEGIGAAKADLFEGAWWILTPTDRSDADAYSRVHAFVTTLGARVMALRPDEHDELMAVVSHVPHLTATALMNLAAERGQHHAGLLALAAGGFRDVTRVAASNPRIWLDICKENGPAIAATLDRFAKELLNLRALVLQGDPEQLAPVFLAARQARRNLPGRMAEGDLYDVRFPVPDRPGVLAEVTTAAGNIGVNIEDLQLSHLSEGGRGTLHLTVIGEDAAQRVCGLLTEKGYEAKMSLL